MSEFGSLLKYEYMKVFRRRIVWIMLSIMVILGIFSVFVSQIGSSVNPSEILNEIHRQRQEGMEISGLEIDDKLLEKYPSVEDMPDGLYDTLMAANAFDFADDKPSAERFYKNREIIISEDNNLYLTSGERMFWSEQEQSLLKPFVFEYNEGGKIMIAMFYTMMVLQILFTAACIPAIFSDEHVRKMSQLNFSCKNGRKKLYLAKITVGFTVNVGAFLFSFFIWSLTAVALFGSYGMDACVQLIYPQCSHHLTIGQLLGIELGVSVAMTVLYSGLTLFFAEILRSSVATMAVLLGGMLFSGMLNIPEDHFRVFGQIWDSFSINFVAIWGILDNRLIKIAGRYFMQYQIVPIVWILISVLFVYVGFLRYRRYQVTR